MKNRTLGLVLDRIYEIQQINKQFYESHWIPWYNKCPPMFWGKCLKFRVTNCDTLWVFKVRKQSVSSHRVDTIEEKAFIAEDNDLPLMATDPTWKKALPIIEKRLKGLIQCPKRQDLVDEHEYFDNRSTHIYRPLNSYKELLYRIITKEYGDQIYDRYRQKKLIRIERGGREFYILIIGNELTLLDEDNIISCNHQD
jgi:hypothetical protein